MRPVPQMELPRDAAGHARTAVAEDALGCQEPVPRGTAVAAGCRLANQVGPDSRPGAATIAARAMMPVSNLAAAASPPGSEAVASARENLGSHMAAKMAMLASGPRAVGAAGSRANPTAATSDDPAAVGILPGLCRTRGSRAWMRNRTGPRNHDLSATTSWSAILRASTCPWTPHGEPALAENYSTPLALCPTRAFALAMDPYGLCFLSGVAGSAGLLTPVGSIAVAVITMLSCLTSNPW